MEIGFVFSVIILTLHLELNAMFATTRKVSIFKYLLISISLFKVINGVCWDEEN